MKKIKRIISFAICISLVASSACVLADSTSTLDVVSGTSNTTSTVLEEEFTMPDSTKSDRFIIKYNNDNMRSRMISEDVESQYEVVSMEDAVDIEEFTAEIMSSNDSVEYVQPDYQLDLAAIDNLDISVVEDINASVIENNDSGRATVTVAVIDTGIDINHELIQDSVFVNDGELNDDDDSDNNGYVSDISGWDFYNNSNVVYDETLGLDQAHGTHIAGIISEIADNAKILPLKVFENGVAYTSDIIEAIEYAEMMGASIVNCSWGSTNENRALEEAMAGSDMVFVCATGNNRLNLSETPIYPASYNLNNIVSVSSVNEDGGLSYFSNYGETVDITAIGRNVTSAFPENEMGSLSGTSVSAAFVSGALALCSENNNVNVETIYSSADKLSNLQGYIDDGRRLNVTNILNDVVSDEIININPVEDFNTEGYVRTPAESWTLFGELNNVAVEAGVSWRAVLKENGTVWTWGLNNYGQLGVGNYTSTTVPQQVSSLADVVEIAAGEGHLLARDSSGNVYSWGYNVRGQLGIGTTTNSNVPVQMIRGTNATGIAAGGKCSYVIKHNAVLWACGENGNGQLGDGTTTNKTTLVEVNLDEDVASVNGNGGASFAITLDGALYSWGHNGYGRLGDGTTEDRGTPEMIIESGIVEVSMGTFDAMALTESGTVYQWGYGATTTPQLISGITGVTKVVTGRQAQFLQYENTIESKGYNSYGTLGIGSTTWTYTWSEIEGSFADFDVMDFTAIALGTNGCIYQWGMIDANSSTYTTAPEKLTDDINDFGADDIDTATEVQVGITNGNLISETDEDYYKLVPQRSGTYNIYSLSNMDLVCKVYVKNSEDGTYTLLASNDDSSKKSSNTSDFCVVADLTAENEYYIYVFNYASAYSGEYTLNIEKE